MKFRNILYNVRDMNLEQVARRAKVSTATVSRVLNNASVVKTSTRARVIKAIEELKYHPNLHARNLAGGKSRTIGMIVSNMENPFFFDIYKTVESDAHAAGFEVVVANTDYRSEQLVASIRLMIGRRVAGLAAVVSEMEPALIEELTDSAIPVVFYDVGAPRQNITNIRVNYRRGSVVRSGFLGIRPGAINRLASMERAKRRWGCRWAITSDPMEQVREYPLVGEVAGLGKQFARGLWRPGVRHVACKREEIATDAVF